MRKSLRTSRALFSGSLVLSLFFGQALVAADKETPEKKVAAKVAQAYRQAIELVRKKDRARAKQILQHIAIYEKEGKNAEIARYRDLSISRLAAMYAEDKQVAQGMEFFISLEESGRRAGLSRLLVTPRVKTNDAEARKIHEAILDQSSVHPDNAYHEAKIIDFIFKSGKRVEAFDRLSIEMPKYLSKSQWYEAQANNQPAKKKAAEIFEALTRKEVVALKNDKSAKRELIRRAYVLYLENFGVGTQSIPMREQYAALLVKGKEYVEASRQFYLVSQAYPVGQSQEKTLLNALGCLDENRALENKTQGKDVLVSSVEPMTDEEFLAVIPYNDRDKEHVRISQEILTKYPSTRDAVEILFGQAFLQYQYQEWDKALPSLEKITFNHPSHKRAEKSAGLILDVLKRKDDLAAISAMTKRMLRTSPRSEKFLARASQYLRQAEMKQIESLEAKNDFAGAAARYLDYARVYGYQDRAQQERAYFQAAISYEKAEDLKSAIGAYVRLIGEFPKSSRLKRSIWQVAKHTEALGRLADAAKYHALYAEKYPEEKRAKESQKLAGLYAWGSGNLPLAEKSLESFSSKYGDPYGENENLLLELYLSQESSQKARSWNAQVLSRKDISPIERVSRSLANLDMKPSRNPSAEKKTLEEALELAEKNRTQFRKTSRGIELLQKLRFWKARDEEREIEREASRVEISKKDVHGALKKRMRLIEGVERAYTPVAKYGVSSWALGALYRTARAYQNLAQDASAAPYPTGLSGPELEYHRSERDALFIDPPKRKAIAFASRCLEQAVEFHLYSNWTARCYGLMASLDSENFTKVRTFHMPSMQLAIPSPDETATRTQVGKLVDVPSFYLSTTLFDGNALSRRLATQIPVESISRRLSEDDSLDNELAPRSFDYRVLADYRRELLSSALEDATPEKGKAITFSYLDLLRVKSPREAVKGILSALEKDPQNTALHNLLAASYFEGGNLAAAEAIWRGMAHRKQLEAVALNNLGVLYMAKGRELKAIEYFARPLEADRTREAYENLGFLALKYHNSGEARAMFRQAQEFGHESSLLEIGNTIAMVQSPRSEDLKDQISSLTKKYKNDPFARISIVYYLIDVENDREAAKELITEYLKDHPKGDETRAPFEKALRDAQKEEKTVAMAGNK